MKDYEKYSIYVHIPFCRARCGYCAFCSSTDFALCGGYFSALAAEAEQRRSKEKICSVFLGGGTPSAVSEKYIDSLFDKLSDCFDLSECREITAECNPESADEDKLACFAANGVNRLSIGLQSANDKTLAAIGRIHRYDDFLRAVCAAEKKGFDNIGADLIIGLPETCEEFLHTVSGVTKLPLSHLSLYALELYDGTPLKDIMPKENDDARSDRMADWYDQAAEILSDNGFLRYEISNFARNGRVCAHNIHYWEEGRYYGLGASAHGFAGNIRYSNTDDIRGYINSAQEGMFERTEEFISSEDEMREYVMLGLRLEQGIDVGDFSCRFSKKFDDCFPSAEKLTADGFLERHGCRVRVPKDKFYVLNSILAELL